MVDHITAWQCIGCGKLDGPQTCVGICKDVKVELVYADDYEELRKQLDAARAEIAALAAQMREIVNTTPRNGQWERNYRALQERASLALKAIPSGSRPARPTATSAPDTVLRESGDASD